MDTRKNIYRYLVAGLAVLVLAAGATAAYAQRPGTLEAGGDSPIAHRGGSWPAGPGDQDTLLAEALGISVEELQEAQAAATEAALAEAVEAGLLTQEQADWLAEGAGFGFLGRMGFGHRGLAAGSDYQALLAEALGISVDELQAAQQAAHAAGLEQAVEDGLITAEQAEMSQARQALMDYIDKEALMAGALGISVEELQEYKAERLRMSELIDELGLDADEVTAALEAAHQAAVDQAVADGVITQEQADQLGTSGRFGFGGRGPGGHGPRGRGFSGGPGNGNGQPDPGSSLLPAADA